MKTIHVMAKASKEMPAAYANQRDKQQQKQKQCCE